MERRAGLVGAGAVGLLVVALAAALAVAAPGGAASRPTLTPTPFGPGPHPPGVPDLSGLEPTPAATHDLAPALPEREKAMAVVRRADGRREAFFMPPDRVEAFVRDLDPADCLLTLIPPASMTRAPPPHPTAVPGTRAGEATGVPPAPTRASPPPPVPAPASDRPAAAVKPPHDWQRVNLSVATELGVQLSVLGLTVSTQAGAGEDTRPVPPTPPLPDVPAELNYLVAFVAFTAPGADPAALVVPDPARLFGTDSLGGRYPVAYVELARHPGVTVGAVTFRGAQQRAKTFGLRAEAVRLGPDGAPVATLHGPWEVGLVEQLSERPRGGSNITMPGWPVQAPGLTVRVECCASGTTGQPWAFAIERPGAPPHDVYAVADTRTGAVGTLSPAAGACVFHWLHATPVAAAAVTPPVPGAAPPPPTPGPRATSTPAGANCAALAVTTPAPTLSPAPRFPTPPAALTAAALPPPPPRPPPTPYPTPATVLAPAFTRQQALDAVREQPRGAGRLTYRRVAGKEVKLTTWGEWEQAAEEGAVVAGRDPAVPIWVVVVRGEVVVSTLVGTDVSPWGGVLLDPRTGAPLAGFARPDGPWRARWDRLPDRDPARR
jgi:hypothetical protein